MLCNAATEKIGRVYALLIHFKIPFSIGLNIDLSSGCCQSESHSAIERGGTRRDRSFTAGERRSYIIR